MHSNNFPCLERTESQDSCPAFLECSLNHSDFSLPESIPGPCPNSNMFMLFISKSKQDSIKFLYRAFNDFFKRNDVENHILVTVPVSFILYQLDTS